MATVKRLRILTKDSFSSQLIRQLYELDQCSKWIKQKLLDFGHPKVGRDIQERDP